MNILQQLRRDLKKIADQKKARLLQRFFKTGIGEYGEGDIFLGITVPQSRKIAKKYYSLDIEQLQQLIKSKFHEERLIALLILVHNFQQGSESQKQRIFKFYISNMKNINNWDLVDLSAPNIVGEELWSSTYLLNGSSKPSGNTQSVRGPAASTPATPVKQASSVASLVRSSFATPLEFLIRLARSENVWERRIAVLATFQFIKHNQFDYSLKLAEILLKDQHDLIHKAVGWMLREVGKRDLETEIEFLNKHYRHMPRTMLRYAIERFPEKLRVSFLKK